MTNNMNHNIKNNAPARNGSNALKKNMLNQPATNKGMTKQKKHNQPAPKKPAHPHQEHHKDTMVETGMQEYVPDYGDPDSLWKEVKTDFSYGDNESMKTCQKCGTKNIIVRDQKGICTCYFCHEQL